MKEFKEKLEKIAARLKSEIAGLRTGRATPALVEDLVVDYYGTKTPLKALASISSPEPRTLVISPWDKNAIQPIERAIQSSSLGLNPVVDKDSIRLTIPALTEERRKELVKLLGKYLEEARIAVRREREEALREVDREEKEKIPRPGGPGSRPQGGLGKISEDEKFRKKQEIQKIVDEINKKIEEIGTAKEKEIMNV